jgi:hypothetical protein
MFLKILLVILLVCTLLVGFIIFGEYLTNKLPRSVFGKWWRKYVVGDGENYPD